MLDGGVELVVIRKGLPCQGTAQWGRVCLDSANEGGHVSGWKNACQVCAGLWVPSAALVGREWLTHLDVMVHSYNETERGLRVQGTTQLYSELCLENQNSI